MKTRALRLLRLAGRALAAVALIAAPGLAAPPDPGAPIDQYDPFDRLSTTVRDAQTQLVWARAVLRDAPYGDPATMCAARSELGPGRRLPTVKELLTLVDENPHQVYEGGALVRKAIDPGAFSSVTYTTPTDSPYWTSTPAGAGQVWTVNFTTGETEPRPTSQLGHVRCVK